MLEGRSAGKRGDCQRVGTVLSGLCDGQDKEGGRRECEALLAAGRAAEADGALTAELTMNPQDAHMLGLR
jgi:hypothetical protein